MEIKLSSEEKVRLEFLHRKERDKRVCDRIKAILLRSEDWSLKQISQALRIHLETVREHLKDYSKDLKLKPDNGGSEALLDEESSRSLKQHLEQNIYAHVRDICTYVRETFQISYTASGMTKWLHRNGFSYKHPKGRPAKADPLKQEEFIKKYSLLKKETPKEEPILFGDGVHPTMATKVTSGWIRRGVDKPIETIASRTRMNIFGAINLETMCVTTEYYETIDQNSMAQYFKTLRKAYPKAPKIHLIIDQGPYNRAKNTKDAAKKYGIILHYLPTYSPNLNPIERLWKVMNEKVRNNVFFSSAKEFRNAILHFFAEIWPRIATSMINRINDNFQTFSSVTSS